MPRRGHPTDRPPGAVPELVAHLPEPPGMLQGVQCLAPLQVSGVQCSCGSCSENPPPTLQVLPYLLCDGAMAPDTLRTVRAAVLAADKVARLVYSTDVVTASVAARIDEAVGELYHTWITVWGARDGVDHAASRPRQGSGSSGASGSSGKQRRLPSAQVRVRGRGRGNPNPTPTPTSTPKVLFFGTKHWLLTPPHHAGVSGTKSDEWEVTLP